MGKKMYYGEEEAAAKLGCSVDDLGAYVTEEKIRVFKDGVRNMYNADEVDALAGELGLTGGEDDLVLTPSDSSLDDDVEITLGVAGEETDAAMGDAGVDLIPQGDSGMPIDAVDIGSEGDVGEPGKDDTAIAVEEGGSIFETGDFEMDSADAMAQTQVPSTLEDQIAIEGVGSGSGLLDLTRESDDTSLGAEILEHIDADGDETPELIEDSLTSGLSDLSQAPAPAVEPAVVEEIDPTAGLFGGLIVGCAVIGLIVTAIALATMLGKQPSFLTWLSLNPLAVVAIGIGVVGLAGLLGFLAGKSAAERQAAIRRAGG